MEPQLAGKSEGAVFTRIISQYDFIDDIGRDFSDGLTQRLFGVVGRSTTTTFLPEIIDKIFCLFLAGHLPVANALWVQRSARSYTG
jgi:hypothetical protein